MEIARLQEEIYRRILFLNEDLLIIMGICVLLAIIIATARPMPQKLCNLIIITSTLKD